MKDFAGVDDLFQPVQALGRMADRLQQLEQPALVVGEVAQRLRQRRMAQSAVLGERGRIGRHEGERKIGVAPVFGEIEMHAPDQPPATVRARHEITQRRAARRELDAQRLRHPAP